MSCDALSRVWNQSRQGGTALLVMLALADNAGPEGYTEVSMEWVARKSRCTVEQLHHIIAHLVSVGELRVLDDMERRYRFAHQLSDCTCYQIMIGVPAGEPNRRKCGATYTKRPFPARLRAAILERDGHCCRNCGATEDLCIDHIVAERLGGTQDPANLQVLCRSCNSRKGTRAL